MNYYIVRIYRRDELDEQSMTGLVETVGAKGAEVFKNPEELWSILKKQAVPRVEISEQGKENKA